PRLRDRIVDLCRRCVWVAQRLRGGDALARIRAAIRPAEQLDRIDQTEEGALRGTRLACGLEMVRLEAEHEVRAGEVFAPQHAGPMARQVDAQLAPAFECEQEGRHPADVQRSP